MTPTYAAARCVPPAASQHPSSTSTGLMLTRPLCNLAPPRDRNMMVMQGAYKMQLMRAGVLLNAPRCSACFPLQACRQGSMQMKPIRGLRAASQPASWTYRTSPEAYGMRAAWAGIKHKDLGGSSLGCILIAAVSWAVSPIGSGRTRPSELNLPTALFMQNSLPHLKAGINLSDIHEMHILW